MYEKCWIQSAVIHHLTPTSFIIIHHLFFQPCILLSFSVLRFHQLQVGVLCVSCYLLVCQENSSFCSTLPGMIVAIISWVLNLINPWTMFRPRTRKLWCATPGDLDQPFSIDCDENQDNIDTLKKKIWEVMEKRGNNTEPHYSTLRLYCPVVQLDLAEKFEVEDGEKLNPRHVITSDPLFPDSKDPNVDVVVVVDGDATSQRNGERPKPQKLRGENDISLVPIFFDT